MSPDLEAVVRPIVTAYRQQVHGDILGYLGRSVDWDALPVWFDDRDICSACGDGAPELTRGGGDTVVDHCHCTGFVRGYLCRRCNMREGQRADEVWTWWRLTAPMLAERVTYDHWSWTGPALVSPDEVDSLSTLGAIRLHWLRSPWTAKRRVMLDAIDFAQRNGQVAA